MGIRNEVALNIEKTLEDALFGMTVLITAVERKQNIYDGLKMFTRKIHRLYDMYNTSQAKKGGIL